MFHVKQKKFKRIFLLKEKESELRELFGTPVSIVKNKDKGKIEIEFYSDDDLERILQLLED